MADPFIGEIRAVAFNYAPMEWAICAGQNMNINQNQALYSLLGLMYGGDIQGGYFKLPDLQGRCAVGSGPGLGLTRKEVGISGGRERITLGINNLPVHNHAASITGTVTGSINVVDDAADTLEPANAMIAKSQAGGADLDAYYKKEPVDATKIKPLSNKTLTIASSGMNVAIGNTGSGAAVECMPPYLTINYIIATQGLYPSRS